MKAAHAYPQVAARYDRDLNPVLALERRTLPALLPSLENLRVIDVAAGTGYWSRTCQERGARVLALDLSIEMLRACPTSSAVADMARLPLHDAVADVTICAFGLGYAPHAWSELIRITRPGGLLLLSDVHPDALARGWKRGFGSVEVEHVPYRLQDLECAGVQLMHLREPHFGPEEQAIFEQAGKAGAFPALSRFPAIYVACFRKASA